MRIVIWASHTCELASVCVCVRVLLINRDLRLVHLPPLPRDGLGLEGREMCLLRSEKGLREKAHLHAKMWEADAAITDSGNQSGRPRSPHSREVPGTPRILEMG